MSAPMHLPHADMGLDIFNFGKPSNFGSLAGRPITMTQAPNIPTPQTPGALGTALAGMQQAPPMPDLVRVQFGVPDKALIGQLLQAANGQNSGLVGVPSTLAAQRLTQLGLPTRADDWTAAQWQQKIDELSAIPTPMSVMGF